MNTHSAEAVAALCTEDVVWEDPAAPQPLIGREAVVLDMLALARQVGAAPAPGSLAERVSVRLQRLAARRARRRHG